MRIAITGGIGSGKSYVCRLLRQRGISIFDCDAAAKRLMNTDAKLRLGIERLVGPDAYTADGQLNKGAVARFLLLSPDNREALNRVVHPAVARDFLSGSQQWMECAILFESGFFRLVDRVVAVTAPTEVRLQRIIERDGITREKALQWISQQWPQRKVAQRSHYVIVNDGTAPLEPQIDQLLRQLALSGGSEQDISTQ